jgi:hypothetical protein
VGLGRGDIWVLFGVGVRGVRGGGRLEVVDRIHAFSVGRNRGIRDAVYKASRTTPLTCNRCRVAAVRAAAVTTALVAESGGDERKV